MRRAVWALAAAGWVGCESGAETAATSDVGSADGSGDVVDAPDTPGAADVAEVDDVLAAEDTPGGVDVEALADTPEPVDIPAAQDVPWVQDTPAAQDVPAAQDIPESPDIPAAVDVPNVADTPGAEDAASPGAAGETCLDALDLEAESEPSGGLDYPYQVTGALGAANDYNPFIDSGLPPACSLVYDAYGLDKVYQVTLQPGEILEMRAKLEPATLPIGLYALDSCDPVSWPDDDKSGKCGSNEFASKGFCGPVAECDPVELSVLLPANAPGPHTYWVVVDQVAGDNATGFTLVWSRHVWK